MTLRKSLSIAAAAAALLVAGQAAAHAKLVTSTPAANAKVAAPKTITLTFNEPLVPAFSGFDLSMGPGIKMAVKTTVSTDRKTLSGAPQGALMPGAYTLHWHVAAADDGHRMDGVLTFTVK